MKDWQDIPEYKKVFEEICKECLIVEKDIRTIPRSEWREFDPEVEKIHKEWKNRLRTVIDNYMKAHPEEFDENGDFKEDT